MLVSVDGNELSCSVHLTACFRRCAGTANPPGPSPSLPELRAYFGAVGGPTSTPRTCEHARYQQDHHREYAPIADDADVADLHVGRDHAQKPHQAQHTGQDQARADRSLRGAAGEHRSSQQQRQAEAIVPGQDIEGVWHRRQLKLKSRSKPGNSAEGT